MPLIDEDTVERIRKETDLVQLIGASVKLKRKGTNWQGLCPFHQEKNASFNVNTLTNRFHCFGCGEGGSAIDWVEKHQGVDFKSAVKILADKLSIFIDLDAKPGLRPGKIQRLMPDPPRIDQKENLQIIQPADVCNWMDDPPAPFLAWLRRKGITQRTARALGLQHSLGIRDRSLVFFFNSGTKIRRELEDSHSCYWANGFADDPWLIDSVKDPRIKRVCICEGESDTMRLIPMVGPDDAVIGLPSASWRPDAVMCWRIGAFREIVFCFDGDKAGRETEARLAPLFLKHAKGVRLGKIEMPEGKDVCTVSQNFLTKELAEPVRIR